MVYRDVDRPTRLFNNRRGLVIAATAFFLSYALCFTLRLVEAPLWNNALFQVSGERLMATFDAYGWMAGAQGTGRLSDQPMSELLVWLHWLTGLSIGTINFWLPAFAGPLVVLPLVALCAFWRVPHIGLTAGVLGGGAYAFLFRTRLGYGDTDVFTLLFPLVLAAAVIMLLSPHCRVHWRPVSLDIARRMTAGYAVFWLQATVIGAIVWAYLWFYPFGKVLAFSIIFGGFGLSLFLSEKKDHDKLLGGLGLVIGLSLGNVWGLLLVTAGLGIAHFAETQCRNYPVGKCIFVAALVLFLIDGGLVDIAGRTLKQIESLSKTTLTPMDARARIPTRFQSVQEVRNIPFRVTARLIGINWVFFCLGLVGFFWLLLRKPLAATLLPLLVFALLSSKLGHRFAMYGGPVIGLGLGYLVDSALLLLRWRKPARMLEQLALAAVCFGFLFSVASDEFFPNPMISRNYAQTLIDLGELTPQNTQLWLWWDYAYAAQYYSGRATFGDGGTQKGLFSLALAHATPSPLQASQIIKFEATVQALQRIRSKKSRSGAGHRYKRLDPTAVDPIAPLQRMQAEDAQRFVDRLAEAPQQWKQPVAPQYLVLSWENFKVARWISHFGRWNLATGKAPSARIIRLSASRKVDENGMIDLGATPVALDGLVVISDEGTTSRAWNNQSGLYGVWNQVAGEAFILDKPIYDSMMVQMLIADPQHFEPYFELVAERFPWTRVYAVK